MLHSDFPFLSVGDGSIRELRDRFDLVLRDGATERFREQSADDLARLLRLRFVGGTREDMLVRERRERPLGLQFEVQPNRR